MADDINNDNGNNSNNSNNNANNNSGSGNNSNNGSQFSAAYVHQLREEAAKWRTRVRDLEAETLNIQIETELLRRGIQAEPHWVTLVGEQSVSEAVEEFVAKHPHLVKKDEEEDTGNRFRRNTPRPLSQKQSNTNTPKSGPGDRSLQEIKKDPVARNKLRDQYRQLLQKSSSR